MQIENQGTNDKNEKIGKGVPEGVKWPTFEILEPQHIYIRNDWGNSDKN